MEVILRKTKITKSIVNQTLVGHYTLYLNWSSYDILGWCLLSGTRSTRWILLYNKEKNNLIRLGYASESEITQKNEQRDAEGGGYRFPTVYRLHTNINHKSSNILWTESEEEILAAKEKLQKFIEEVNQKGQIFI